MLSVSVAPITIVHTSAEVLSGHTVPFLINLHNNLVKRWEKTPQLKTWKEPKAKLIKRIIEIQKAIAEANTTIVKPAVAKGADMSKHPTRTSKLRKNIEKAVKGKAPKANGKANGTKTSVPRDNELTKYILAMKQTTRWARVQFRKFKVKKVDGHYVLNAETKKALGK